MSDEKLIGHGTCPVCASVKARFTVSKKLLACMTCNACNTQIFARSDRSDELLRKNIKPAAQAVEPVKTPAAPAPAAAVVPEKSAPEPVKTETKKPAAPGWGILGAFNG